MKYDNEKQNTEPILDGKIDVSKNTRYGRMRPNLSYHAFFSRLFFIRNWSTKIPAQFVFWNSLRNLTYFVILGIMANQNVVADSDHNQIIYWYRSIDQVEISQKLTSLFIVKAYVIHGICISWNIECRKNKIRHC